MVEKEGRSFLPRLPPLDRSADFGDEEKELRQASDPVLPVPAPVRKSPLIIFCVILPFFNEFSLLFG